jgi:hypothetical protein
MTFAGGAPHLLGETLKLHEIGFGDCLLDGGPEVSAGGKEGGYSATEELAERSLIEIESLEDCPNVKVGKLLQR